MTDERNEPAAGADVSPLGRWDLAHVFAGDADAVAYMTDLAEEATAFAERHAERAPGADPDAWARILGEVDALTAKLDRVRAYRALRALDAPADERRDELARALAGPMERFMGKVRFVFAGWRALDDEQRERLAGSGQLRSWGEYLGTLLPVARRNRTADAISSFARREWGANGAWRELHERTIAAMRFGVETGGVWRQVGIAQRRGMIRNADPQIRRGYLDGFHAALEREERVLAACFDAVITDRVEADRFGGYPDAYAQAEEHQRVRAGFIPEILELVRGRYDLFRRWARLRAHLDGTPALSAYDLYAPARRRPQRITYEHAQRLLARCVGEFAPEVRAYVRRLFAAGHVDAAPGAHKAGTIGCRPVAPGIAPYITMTWADDADSATTLAHEVGHALHRGFSADRWGPIRAHTGSFLGETAAVYLGDLMAQVLVADVADGPERLRAQVDRIGAQLDGLIIQTRMSLFEADLYRAVADGRTLTASRITALWCEHLDEQNADAITPVPGAQRHWSSVPHFMNHRFGMPAYAIAELAVAGLMADRAQDPKRTDRLVCERLLCAGASVPAGEIYRALGLDMDDVASWGRGLDLIDAQLGELEAAVGFGAAAASRAA